MKTNPDHEREDEILDAVLRDENWEAGNAAFKAAALGKFQAHQRTLRVVRWTGGVAGLVVVVAVVIAVQQHGGLAVVQQEATDSKIEGSTEALQAQIKPLDRRQGASPLPGPRPVRSSRGEGEERVATVQSVASVSAHLAGSSVKYMTDDELVAAFPQGSCFLAEVDGKKELVFFDPEVAKASMAGGVELAGNGM